ncbi:hypothetical protein PUN28_007927 [Cardiocondyla obscurior]|uniref:O-acyltransferase n=1 Tax=Cardiocondyla obscurior TaxID=286306 RepID=A0AAW2FWR8_9HYME
MSSVVETINLKHSDVANGLHEKDKDVTSGNAIAGILREMTTDEMQKRIQEIKEDVLGHVNNCMNDMMSEVLRKIEVPLVKNGELLCNIGKYRDTRKSSKKDVLPDKEFIERNSLLTDLFQIPHIRTIYNLFLTTLILLFLNTVVFDIIELGMIRVGTNTIRLGFKKFPTCVYIWSFMQASTFCVHVVFTLWAHQRLQFSPKSLIGKLWDYGWLSIFILYQVLFLVFPMKAVLKEDLSIGCSLIIFLEQMRMMMKCHAYVRSAASRFLSYKPHSETPRPSGPKFSQYLYFLFAPTLVYRDEYPRTRKIRWTVVIRNFVEVILAIFYLAFIMERFVLSNYDYRTQRKWVAKNIIEDSIPGILYFITGQYLLLHSWMNAWAEMLRFGDRLFYKDWWTATTYHAYYRTWNTVVHDWLYTYIYKDMYEIVVPQNRMVSALTVFFVSAAFHEYILSFSFRFFYPVMFILFGVIGVPLFFVRKMITSNVFMWFTWSVGNGIIFNLYCMEYYARIHCPPHSNYYLDLFIPRSWSCEG